MDDSMPVTLKELGARAHVHPSTVSRVANNDPSLRIAPPTRQRIEALLRETEYQPNGVARGLKLRQTLVLAVVIPDITNPFFAALFRGVEDAASPRGYNVLLCNTDGSPARQRSHLQSLHARRVDGVIMASSFLKDPTVRWLRHQGVPYV
ncbi:MAG: LacI family transcriptional regulator, partial [Chloroflexota bacterium]